MEYTEGVLILSGKGDRVGGFTEFIKWDDIRSIQFNPVVMSDWRDLVTPTAQGNYPTKFPKP